MYKRLKWIKNAEAMLNITNLKKNSENHEGVVKKKSSKTNKKKHWFPAVGILIGYFYLLLMLLDIICIFILPIN